MDIGIGITNLAWAAMWLSIWIVGGYWLSEFTAWIGDCIGAGIVMILDLFNH